MQLSRLSAGLNKTWCENGVPVRGPVHTPTSDVEHGMTFRSKAKGAIPYALLLLLLLQVDEYNQSRHLSEQWHAYLMYYKLTNIIRVDIVRGNNSIFERWLQLRFLFAGFKIILEVLIEPRINFSVQHTATLHHKVVLIARTATAPWRLQPPSVEGRERGRGQGGRGRGGDFWGRIATETREQGGRPYKNSHAKTAMC